MRLSPYQLQLMNNTDQNLSLPLASEFGIYLLRGAIKNRQVFE